MKNKLKEYLRKVIDRNCSIIHNCEKENEELRKMLEYLQSLIDIKHKLGKDLHET